MDVNTISMELQRLRLAVSSQTPNAQAMHEIKTVRQEDGGPTKLWFRHADRELMAGEDNGRCVWLEYSFPTGSQSLVLRWRDGAAAQLWRIDRNARHNPLNRGSEILEFMSGMPFPRHELDQMPIAIQHLPATLRDHVLNLALELSEDVDPEKPLT